MGREHLETAQRVDHWYIHSPDVEDYGAWLEFCKAQDWPYVEVQDKGAFALVNLDTISCKRLVLTWEGAKRVRMALLRYAVPYAARGASAPLAEYRSGVHGGLMPPTPGTSIWCERIPLDKADEVARLVVEIINQDLVPWAGATVDFKAAE